MCCVAFSSSAAFNGSKLSNPLLFSARDRFLLDICAFLFMSVRVWFLLLVQCYIGSCMRYFLYIRFIVVFSDMQTQCTYVILGSLYGATKRVTSS